MTQVLTYSKAKAPPRWCRWLMTAVGWPTLGAVGVLSIGTLWTTRVPDPHPFPMLLEFIAAGFLAGWIGLRFLIRTILWFVYRRPWREFWISLWRFFPPIGIGIAVVLLVSFDIPERLAWQISKPGMQRLADDVLAQSAGTTGDMPVFYGPRWVGVYFFNEVAYLPDSRGVRMALADAGFMESAGFAYFPDGPPTAPATGPAGPAAAYHAGI